MHIANWLLSPFVAPLLTLSLRSHPHLAACTSSCHQGDGPGLDRHQSDQRLPARQDRVLPDAGGSHKATNRCMVNEAEVTRHASAAPDSTRLSSALACTSPNVSPRFCCLCRELTCYSANCLCKQGLDQPVGSLFGFPILSRQTFSPTVIVSCCSSRASQHGVCWLACSKAASVLCLHTLRLLCWVPDYVRGK